MKLQIALFALPLCISACAHQAGNTAPDPNPDQSVEEVRQADLKTSIALESATKLKQALPSSDDAANADQTSKDEELQQNPDDESSLDGDEKKKADDE